MHGKLTLRNYRCFDWSNPLVIEFDEGYIAFIGPNNSGKSTALKSIYELRNIWSNIDQVFASDDGFGFFGHGVSDDMELVNENNPAAFEIELEVPPPDKACMREMAYYVTKAKVKCDFKSRLCSLIQLELIDQGGAKEIVGGSNLSLLKRVSSSLYLNSLQVNRQNILRFAASLREAKYFPAFRNAINEGAGSYYDIPVGTALVASWDSWKAGNIRVQKLAIAEIENKIAELLGFNTLQINADQSQKTLDVIIDGRPHKLYEVGSGVAQLIIVFAASLIFQPTYILIDEPELSLHPALQLKFLTTLGAYAKHGVLFSTHSIGLARSCANKIYSVSKVSSSVSKVDILGERDPNYLEWLGELSYSGRIDLGCEGILLLEGPTEILCFQQFLRKVGKEHKYLLMSLGGSSLINGNIGTYLAELTRVVDHKNIHIFVDSEKESDTAPLLQERIDFKNGCEQLGVHVVLSERRATENYFDENALKAAFGDGYVPLDKFQKLKDSIKPWSKSSNWKVASQLRIKDIEHTDLEQFLLQL